MARTARTARMARVGASWGICIPVLACLSVKLQGSAGAKSLAERKPRLLEYQDIVKESWA